MQQTPKSLRLHIALLGRVNAGKSSFLNLVAGQNVSITSDIAGTTTDVVEKTQELLPLGPVVWLDTAGFGDETALAAERLFKTRRVLDLCYFQGKKYAEAAEVLGISANTVHKHISKAMAFLREVLFNKKY